MWKTSFKKFEVIWSAYVVWLKCSFISSGFRSQVFSEKAIPKTTELDFFLEFSSLQPARFCFVFYLKKLSRRCFFMWILRTFLRKLPSKKTLSDDYFYILLQLSNATLQSRSRTVQNYTDHFRLKIPLLSSKVQAKFFLLPQRFYASFDFFNHTNIKLQVHPNSKLH